MRKFWPLCHCPIHNHVTNRSQHPKINMAEILNFIITSNVLNYCISTVAWANKWRSVFSIQNELWVWIPSPWSNKIEQTVHWFENNCSCSHNKMERWSISMQDFWLKTPISLTNTKKKTEWKNFVLMELKTENSLFLALMYLKKVLKERNSCVFSSSYIKS